MKNDRENERGWRRVKKLKKWTICMNFVGVGRCSRVGWLVAMTTTPVSWWTTLGPDPFILLASPTQRPTPTRPTVVSCHALIRTLLPIPLGSSLCLRSTDVERATRRPNDHPYFLLWFNIHRIRYIYIYTYNIVWSWADIEKSLRIWG